MIQVFDMIFKLLHCDTLIKEPQYVINLRKCITDHVDVVSNDICARPNTFLLVTVRSPEHNDKVSVNLTCNLFQKVVNLV